MAARLEAEVFDCKLKSTTAGVVCVQPGCTSASVWWDGRACPGRAPTGPAALGPACLRPRPETRDQGGVPIGAIGNRPKPMCIKADAKPVAEQIKHVCKPILRDLREKCLQPRQAPLQLPLLDLPLLDDRLALVPPLRLLVREFLQILPVVLFLFSLPRPHRGAGRCSVVLSCTRARRQNHHGIRAPTTHTGPPTPRLL